MEEPRAEPIPGDVAGEAAAEGGNVTLSYSKEVSVDLEAETAQLFLANPGTSNQDMVLRLVVQDTVLLQSGAITPGRQVKSLALPEASAQLLTAGTYAGSFRIFFFDKETGREAVINTEIPVTITVR